MTDKKPVEVDPRKIESSPQAIQFPSQQGSFRRVGYELRVSVEKPFKQILEPVIHMGFDAFDYKYLGCNGITHNYVYFITQWVKPLNDAPIKKLDLTSSLSPTEAEYKVKELLESSYSLPELMKNSVVNSFSRVHDDSEGRLIEHLEVSLTRDGDAWVKTTSVNGFGSLRFRNSLGGGRSLRVNNALKILAEAIRLDNLESPQ